MAYKVVISDEAKIDLKEHYLYYKKAATKKLLMVFSTTLIVLEKQSLKVDTSVFGLIILEPYLSKKISFHCLLFDKQ